MFRQIVQNLGLATFINSFTTKEEEKSHHEQIDYNINGELRSNPQQLIFKLPIIHPYELLVLSGGAKKGFAQLGMLHCLYTNKIIDFDFINVYIGTSIGSIISYLLIIGLKPIDIFSIVCTNHFDFEGKIINILLNQHGDILNNFNANFGIDLFSDIFLFIEKITKEKLNTSSTSSIPTLSELYKITKKHFICVVHNLEANKFNDEHETEYLDHILYPDLSCIDALKMSCNIPILGIKHQYQNKCYIDGAQSDNFPVKYAYSLYPEKKILALGVINKKDTCHTGIVKYILNIILSAVEMNTYNSFNFKKENIHSILLQIQEENPFVFQSNIKENFKLFSAGYKNMENMMYKETHKKEKIE